MLIKNNKTYDVLKEIALTVLPCLLYTSCPSCTIEIKELNTVEQKITFALHFGPIVPGKVAITANKPTFTAGA